MKIFPEKKLIAVGLIVAFVFQAGGLLTLGSSQDLIRWVLNLLINTILIIICLRIVAWVVKKVGLTK